MDWLKLMVGTRRSEDVADPKMEGKPSSRALKRALLVALRCVDPDATKRPKMGHVVHMLEAEEFPFRDVSPFNSIPFMRLLSTPVKLNVSCVLVVSPPVLTRATHSRFG